MKIMYSSLVLLLFVGAGVADVKLHEKKGYIPTKSVIENAKWQTTQDVTYDGSYQAISYPMGDVSPDKGVCADVIIRAYRAAGIDLQQLIHEDMLANKSQYDKRRYSEVIDANIDHRRCPNLQTFFTRQGARLSVSESFLPGDIVFWRVAAGHVGIVIDEKVPGTDRYYVVHNIGSGPHKEDFLYNAEIVGHYRWKIKTNL